MSNNWNYRVMEHENEREDIFQIHEVYYDEDGVAGYNMNGQIKSQSLEDLKWTLEQMLKATEKEILKYK